MSFVRRGLAAAAFTALIVSPGATAFASSDPEIVRGLATDGANLVAEESELLELAAAPDVSAAELAELRSTLRTVDAHSTEIMQQLDLLGVDLSNAIRAAMAPLPEPGSPSAGMQPALPPPAVVYDAAIADLMRIAATPGASTPLTTTSSGGTSFGLLAVAAIALLALGVAALANTLRRTEDDEDLAAMAWSDGLTGVANRRRLDHDIAAFAAIGGPTAVIMVDVDHFKQVNDSYGHHVGDEVLRAVGAALANHVRQDDVVYRYGGEEFCILLPGAAQAEAQVVADRVVSATRSIQLPDGRHVTVSVGVADGRAADVAGTLETADRALFAAKSGGRDRVAAAPTSTGTGTGTIESI